jgi:hypothetical protein
VWLGDGHWGHALEGDIGTLASFPGPGGEQFTLPHASGHDLPVTCPEQWSQVARAKTIS